MKSNKSKTITLKEFRKRFSKDQEEQIKEEVKVLSLLSSKGVWVKTSKYS